MENRRLAIVYHFNVMNTVDLTYYIYLYINYNIVPCVDHRLLVSSWRRMTARKRVLMEWSLRTCTPPNIVRSLSIMRPRRRGQRFREQLRNKKSGVRIVFLISFRLFYRNLSMAIVQVTRYLQFITVVINKGLSIQKDPQPISQSSIS